MPANVERMFSVREGTWHGLEDRLDDYPSMEDVKSYFGFEVVRKPLAYIDDDGAIVPAPEGWAGLIRSDTGGFLAPTSDSYGVVQPSVLVDLTEALVGGSDKEHPVRITTGGLLNEGRIIWTLAEVDREWFVTDDESAIKPYVLLVNSFDKSYSLTSKTTGVRVVCRNTLDLSIAERSGTVFRFKHTSNVMDRVEAARSILRGAVHAIDTFVEMSNELVAMKVKDAGIRQFLAAFIPEPPDLKKTDAKMASIIEAREAVLDILSGSTGTVTPKHSSTAYGLYQAGVEFIDWQRPARSAESRFARTMLKDDKAKAELLTLVRAAAKVS